MQEKVIHIKAVWDDEAAVWFATSDDIQGLATEAETTDALMQKLKCLIPELMELNAKNHAPEEIPFTLLSEVTAVAHAC